MIGHLISLDAEEAGRLGYSFPFQQVLEPRHFGPPPSAGWWPVAFFDTASSATCRPALRWWNGSRWSVPAEPEDTADIAARCAESTALLQCGLFWLRRPGAWAWPKTAG